jgi:hypothetical protein
MSDWRAIGKLVFDRRLCQAESLIRIARLVLKQISLCAGIHAQM